MKQIAVLVLIPLILTGCGPKEEVDVKKLSSAIIPYEPMSEKVMDAAGFPEEIRDHANKTTEIMMLARREFFSDILRREFSPEELDKLDKIFSSELVVRVQRILVSDECVIGSTELAKPKIEEMTQNQNMEPAVPQRR